jgi:hypothetical protein
MKLLQRSALLCSLIAVLGLPGTALADDAPKLDASPATASAPAPVDDMQAMQEHLQALMQAKGMGPGARCHKLDGQAPGLMPGLGLGPMGPDGRKCEWHEGPGMVGPGHKCYRLGEDEACGCAHGRDLARRLDELEKRMDMMQMLLQMMIMR